MNGAQRLAAITAIAAATAVALGAGLAGMLALLDAIQTLRTG